MNDPKPEPQAAPSQPAARGSELERTLEDLHLEPTLQELDPDQADQVRGGELGMMGMSGSFGGMQKTSPF